MVETAQQRTPRHPMGVVVQRTGLTAHVLRAWERRYGAVDPGRTKGGQRLYSDADVIRLRLLKRVTEVGRPIGSVARLPTEELAALVGEDAAAGTGGVGGVGEVLAADGGEPVERWDGPGAIAQERYLSACLSAADALDGAALRSELMRAVVRLTPAVFVGGVVVPLLHRVGALWEQGVLRPAQEHVVSTAVRQVLDWLLGEFEPGEAAPILVSSTPSGELHEFGAMLASVVAADAGWRVLYLGPSLPPGEIAAAALLSAASVVAVSVVREQEDPGVWKLELEELRDLLPRGVLLVVGGRSSGRAVPGGVTRVEELGAFRQLLSAAGPAEALEATE